MAPTFSESGLIGSMRWPRKRSCVCLRTDFYLFNFSLVDSISFQSLVVLLCGICIYQNVIHKNGDSLQALQCRHHFPLGDFGSTRDPKWQAVETVPAKKCNEGCQLSAVTMQGICQNLPAASNDKNTLALLSFASISSKVGRINRSLFTASLNFFKPTHTHFPIFLQDRHHGCTPIFWLHHLLHNVILLHPLSPSASVVLGFYSLCALHMAVFSFSCIFTSSVLSKPCTPNAS